MEEIITTSGNANPVFVNRELQAATNKVLKIGATVRKCAFEVAYIMAQVDLSECYKDDGFESVHEWAMKTFGFRKSASYTLLRIGHEYTHVISDSKGKVKGYGSNLVMEGEADFTTSQIEKMLPGGHALAAELVCSDEISPSMTCKEIEKVIKAHTKPEPAEPEPAEPEPAEPDEPAEPEVLIIVTDSNGTQYDVPASVLNRYKVGVKA